ncbi:MAG TPA: hypothetical protein EYG16_08925 [Deltaproteobacteria bacterium]|nr:hypothetical protein [Candidatus Binatota bacterium]HIL13779.1 hypothetical protein [Deltaproteobacteria bacterium]
MKPVLTLIGLVIGSLVVAGCATTQSQVANGLYTSPHENFTVPVPNMGLGLRIQDQTFETSGFVSFHDDFGELRRIDYSPLPANATVVYRDLIQNVVLPDMQSRFPGTKMLHEELLNTDEREEYFFVFEIPGGSPLVDMKTETRMNSTRGYLYFMSGGYIYSLSAQQSGIGDLFSKNEKDEATTSKSFDDLLGSLNRFKETVQFKG